MKLGEVLARYPRSATFAADGTASPAVVSTCLNRMFATDVRLGSGARREYSEHDVRLFVAYRVVLRGLVRLGVVTAQRAGTTNPSVLAQLREQTRDSMPWQLRLEAADIVLTVEVPFVLRSELNAVLELAS